MTCRVPSHLPVGDAQVDSPVGLGVTGRSGNDEALDLLRDVLRVALNLTDETLPQATRPRCQP